MCGPGRLKSLNTINPTIQQAKFAPHRRATWKPVALVTKEMRKTAGANMSMTMAEPMREPRTSRTVPMKTRPATAPATAVTPVCLW